MDLKNGIRTLGLDSNLGEEWVLDLGEFIDMVADGLIVVAMAVVFFAEIFVNAKLSFVS